MPFLGTERRGFDCAGSVFFGLGEHLAEAAC